jgi:hypothetical protein
VFTDDFVSPGRKAGTSGRLPQNQLQACLFQVANDKGSSHQQRHSSL